MQRRKKFSGKARGSPENSVFYKRSTCKILVKHFLNSFGDISSRICAIKQTQQLKLIFFISNKAISSIASVHINLLSNKFEPFQQFMLHS